MAVNLGDMKTRNLESIREESPHFVRTSLAAAITLGFVPGRFLRDAKLYTVNLLLHYESGCVARCSYCGLNRARGKKSKIKGEESFIRVEWPLFELEKVVEALQRPQCNYVERTCISMITHKRAREDTLLIAEKILTKTDKDVSVLISPSIVDKTWIKALKERGVDKLGIALDTATSDLFNKHRGKKVGGPHRWFHYWDVIRTSATIFPPGDISVHLIVGLGEREEEMLEIVQRCYDMGVHPHLFSFFPEPETVLQSQQQPPIETYRRIQLARYLID